MAPISTRWATRSFGLRDRGFAESIHHCSLGRSDVEPILGVFLKPQEKRFRQFPGLAVEAIHAGVLDLVGIFADQMLLRHTVAPDGECSLGRNLTPKINF